MTLEFISLQNKGEDSRGEIAMYGPGRQSHEANLSITMLHMHNDPLMFTLSYFPLLYLWRRNAYDGELEFFVVLSEKAKRTEESSYEEEHRKRQKACKMFCFYNG